MADRRNFIARMLGLSALATGPWAPAPSAFAAAVRVGPAEDLERIRTLLAGKDPLKWVFVGDSITHGAKHTFGARSYPEIFGERMRWEMRRVRDVVINTAISGNTSVDILNDYEWRIRQFRPAVVFIMVGTNDAAVKRDISLARYREALVTLVRRIRDEAAVPVLQTPNPVLLEKAAGRERIGEYVDVIRAVAATEGLILVDHWAWWTERSKADILEVHKWMNDELHPNGRGHDQMAKLLFKAIGIFDPASFTGKEHALEHLK